MIKEEKQENMGFIDFQVFSFTHKIQRLASHIELKKDFVYLVKKNRVRYKKLISQLDIRVK
ncbi:hypothetical protein BAE44_0009083 [Dichanthelium oligosanthes]|uniref:Small ribosomal subunit protein uS15c n=1 Tax=Dichanthelium oligosanthes TaxID=888268 RepID=A0A1E5VXQ8_9POAL|nr:hypothetical protein BAE44_0009083 [Dichanthelium oligosanthes]